MIELDRFWSGCRIQAMTLPRPGLNVKMTRPEKFQGVFLTKLDSLRPGEGIVLVFGRVGGKLRKRVVASDRTPTGKGAWAAAREE